MNVYQLVAKALNCDMDALSESSQFGITPEWDSLGHINVMVLLNKQCNVDINEETIGKYNSIREITKIM